MAARVPIVERGVVRNEAQHDAGPASPCIREVCYGRQRDSVGEVIDRQKLAITFGCDLTTSYPRNPHNPRGIEALAGDYTRPVNAGATICHLHVPAAVDDENLRTDGLSKTKSNTRSVLFKLCREKGLHWAGIRCQESGC